MFPEGAGPEGAEPDGAGERAEALMPLLIERPVSFPSDFTCNRHET